MFLLWLLTSVANIHYLISGAIAIEASILYNFFLNDLWTFRKHQHGKFMHRLFKFNFMRLGGLLINFIALWAFTAIGVNYLVSDLIGIALATIYAYLVSIWWVWKK